MKLASPTFTIGRASQRLMELEVDALMGAGYGEKSGARLAKRYGYREHDWQTRGDGGAAHSDASHRQLLPGILEPRRIAEAARRR